jgi:wobble nucleotide-excising tRNase
MLRIKKARFSEDWVKQILSYKSILDKIKIINKTIDGKSAGIDAELKSIFDEHTDNINSFLGKMRMDFSIKKITPKEHKGAKQTHFCDYEFSFVDGTSIPISNKRSEGDEEPEDKHHFGNTFSDSDRRLSLLPFFFRRLKRTLI